MILLFFIPTFVQSIDIFAKKYSEIDICAMRLAKILSSVDVTLIKMKEDEQFSELFYKLSENRIFNRKFSETFAASNYVRESAYVIAAVDFKELIDAMDRANRDACWNPKAPHIILLDVINTDEVLQNVFQYLARLYVFKIILVISTKDPYIVMYDFDKVLYCNTINNKLLHFRCDNIINNTHFNHKAQKVINNKEAIVNCNSTFILHSIFPFAFLKTAPILNEFSHRGYEDIFFKFAVEYLNIPHNENVNYDKVGFVFENHSSSGLLNKMQNGMLDGITGGMLLVDVRLRVLDYVYPRFPDTYIMVIPKAAVIEKWKAIFLTFNVIVWCGIFFVFTLFSVLSMAVNIFNVKNDRVRTVLSLYGYLFGNICDNVDTTFMKRLMILIWVVNSWLLSIIFQSKLSSIFTSPGYYHQINSIEEISKNNFDFIVNELTFTFIKDSLGKNFTDIFSSVSYCRTVLQCLKNVSLGGKKATVTSYSYLKYNEEQFRNEVGEPLLHYLPKPFNQMWLSTYVRRGFPKTTKLRSLEMSIIENGLLEKSINDVKARTMKSSNYNDFKEINLHDLGGIYYILMCGWLLSFIVFITEIMLINKNNDTE